MLPSPTVDAHELEAGLAAARERWPGVHVDATTLAAHLAERLPLESRSRASFVQRVPELALACACERGDSVAMRHFEAAFFGEVDAVAARVGWRTTASELRQVVREKLFFGGGAAKPKIGEYKGRGDLRRWVRVVAMHAAVSLERRRPREVLDEAALLLSVDLADDPELGYIKRVYRKEFASAFAEAFERLSGRHRSVLRYVLDGLPTERVAIIYGVNPATARRWVVGAREALLRALRSALMTRLGVGVRELESILRLIRSNIELRWTAGGAQPTLEPHRDP
jgi:RNA polymerase sigma-70 factor (ECF subfamily)